MGPCELIVTVIMLSPMTLQPVETTVSFCDKKDVWNAMVNACEEVEGKGYIPDKMFIPADGSPPLLSCVKGEA